MPPSAPTLRIALVSLHTSPFADPGSGDVGGMNVVVRHTALALAEAGHRVEVLTRRSTVAAPRAEELSPRLVLRHLDAGPARPVGKGEHEAFIEEFGHALATCGPYDVVHSHHWFSGMAALPYARSRGVPHAQSFHSIAADPQTPLAHGERPESPGRLAGEAWLARVSDVVIAVSRAEARTVAERLRGAPERTVVVPPGVDPSLFHPGRPESGPAFVLVAARLEPLKGVDLAIRAISALPGEFRPELVITGGQTAEGSGYEDELRALATDVGVADRTRFLGPVGREELATLLRNARAVLVPSHSETYGLIALEAAASGAPVVAAAAGGLVEAVQDGVTGVLLDTREPAVWAEAIKGILIDPVRARSLSTAARARASARSWGHVASETVAAYRGLIADNRAL